MFWSGSTLVFDDASRNDAGSTETLVIRADCGRKIMVGPSFLFGMLIPPIAITTRCRLGYNVEHLEVPMRSRVLASTVALFFSSLAATAQTPERSKVVKEFVRVDAPKIILTHVRVIDGTGAPAVEDQNVVIEAGKILAIQPGADAAADGQTTVLDLHGYTVMPG